ncbi:MAG: hypothetical protein JSW51_07300 [Gemmatimonadota bacterium]|nr:MAG: hypothetical protein JSW51_07300 [Gemmatimonadota bacterium]
MPLPPWRFVRAILLRSTLIWIPLRLVATATNAMVPRGPADPSPWALSPSAILAVLVLATWLTWIDCARRSEIVFHNNLGVSRVALVGLAGALPLLYSLIVATVVRL